MGRNCSENPDTKDCIRKINQAIHQLRNVRRETRDGNLGEAKARLADSLHNIADVLHCLNELPPTLSEICDPNGAIPLTSGLNGAPTGTSDMLPGNKYITPVFGYIITWSGDTLTVCVNPNSPTGVYTFTGSPLVITNGDGTQLTVPSINGNPQAAAIGTNEGTFIVVGTSEVNGSITKARYVSIPVIETSASYQGFNTRATESYLEFVGGKIVDYNMTLHDFLGV